MFRAKAPQVLQLPLGVEWDVGAPYPTLITSEHRSFVICRSEHIDPEWDGTYVTLVDPNDETQEDLLVFEFVKCHTIELGGPNDEVLRGHPMYSFGLRGYAINEVLNSPKVQDARKVNSAHSYHRDEVFDELRHFILPFHDSTVEALANGLEVRVVKGSLKSVVAGLVTDSLFN